MIAPLAKFIDWSGLQMAYAVVGLRHVPRPKWKLEEALEFLNGPDFIPAASAPARIEFDGPRHFQFSTPRPCEVEKNNIVYGGGRTRDRAGTPPSVHQRRLAVSSQTMSEYYGLTKMGTPFSYRCSVIERTFKKYENNDPR